MMRVVLRGLRANTRATYIRVAAQESIQPHDTHLRRQKMKSPEARYFS